ncbi:uncharacterized protein LOC111003514 [Pieris rapae]|uniref:uncharacterized protein LOC111003514 n=1 Tax=Pieris rapae TaxID=64459 RepID=UPI001E27F5DA|nr:uncharacterized protein LOC111003514 [Pieris rapae]
MNNVASSAVILYKKPVSVLANRNISPTIDCIGQTPTGTFDAVPTAENTKTDGRIRSISRTYINYCCLARKLNDSEDIVILIYLFKLALNLAVSLLNVLKYDEYITSGVSMVRVAYTLHNIFIALTTGTRLMLLVEPSYRAQVELRKTTLLVSRALNQALERNDLDQLNELRHLLKMLHLNRPVYSAFGVFNIGRPLVTAVLSGTATILVMLQ